MQKHIDFEIFLMSDVYLNNYSNADNPKIEVMLNTLFIVCWCIFVSFVTVFRLLSICLKT